MSRLRILFSGMVADVPWQGGATWVVLNHLLGLRALGHEVLLVEPTTGASLPPEGVALQDSDNARYFRSVMDRYGLTDAAALYRPDTRECVGVPLDEVVRFARGADLLINVAGMLRDEDLLGPVPVRAYLDLDPGFTQLWALQGIDMHLDGHTHFVTVGPHIGREDCPVPTLGRSWIGTVQPVSLDLWPASDGVADGAFTTVAHWRSYGTIWHDGVQYGQKVHALRPLLALPGHVDERLRPALSIHADERDDLAALDEHGWSYVDPSEVAATPEAYQAFLRGSKAELAVAKSGYIEGRTGWFSDRSVCYLASGRPVVAHDTGFPSYLPTGEGLLAFRDLPGAAEAIAAVADDYTRHTGAARAIAEEHFGARAVLGRLLDALGAVT